MTIGRDPGSMTVTATMSEAVTERDPMSREVEGQTIEAVPITVEGILKGLGPEIGTVVIFQEEETRGG